jgi:RNA binding exosome subunit
MTPTEIASFGAGAIAVLSGVLIGLRFLVRGWLNELRPNGGSSMKDQLTRLEKRVDDLFSLKLHVRLDSQNLYACI